MLPAQREQTLHNLVLFYHIHHHKNANLHDNDISWCVIGFSINYKYLHNILQSNCICIKVVGIFISEHGVEKGRGITGDSTTTCLKDNSF